MKHSTWNCTRVPVPMICAGLGVGLSRLVDGDHRGRHHQYPVASDGVCMPGADSTASAPSMPESNAHAKRHHQAAYRPSPRPWFGAMHLIITFPAPSRWPLMAANFRRVTRRLGLLSSNLAGWAHEIQSWPGFSPAQFQVEAAMPCRITWQFNSDKFKPWEV